MKIKLFLDANPVKKRHCKLSHKYKYIVKNEIDNMLVAGIICLVDQYEWASPIVV